MRTPQLHMPHFRQRSRTATSEANRHHHEPTDRRLGRIENLMDYLVVGGIVLIGAAMAWGLTTASG